MRPSIGKLWIVLLFLTATIAWAQEKDLRSWSSLELRYEPTKSWDFTLMGQFRLKNDLGDIDEYFTQFQVDRTLLKGVKLGVGVRYIFENDNSGAVQGYENHFRYHMDASYQHRANRLRFKYRFRYQNKNELGVSDEARKYVRFKAGTEFNIKGWKLDPKLSAEFFNRIKKRQGQSDKLRITLGTEYNMKKAGTIAAFYRRQWDVEKIDREILSIIGLKYRYTFK